ncbi:class I SAM-dependent methyltransferase [bacterium]|nr:class I SAM-dependent methyltransferase [candidate division CSSED10-310 bacterium]
MKDSQPWYIQAFQNTYSLVYPHRNESVAQCEVRSLVQSLQLTKPKTILDVGCGSGRHMYAFESMGFHCFGLDLSMHLLEKASVHRNLHGRLVYADMRYFPFRFKFDVIVNLFSSFGYFLNSTDNRSVLDNIHNCLSKNGLFILDHINKTYLQNSLVPESIYKTADAVIRQKRMIVNNRITKKVVITYADQSEIEYTESVQLYTEVEMKELLESCGFVVSSVWGDYSGECFNEHSKRMVMICQAH